MPVVTKPEAGDLLPISTIGDRGLVVLDDGTLGAVIELDALSPLIEDEEDVQALNQALAGIAVTLPDQSRMRLITTADPFNIAKHAKTVEPAVNAAADHVAADGRGAQAEAMRMLALTRLDGVQEATRQIAAIDLHHYLVITKYPSSRVRPGVLKEKHLEAALKDLHQHVGDVMSRLRTEPLNCNPRLLNGLEILAFHDRIFNPGSDGATIDKLGLSLLAEPDMDKDRQKARARRLKQTIARSEIDHTPVDHLLIGGIPVVSRTLSSVPVFTYLGWLMHVMATPYPFTVSATWETRGRFSEMQLARLKRKQLRNAANTRARKGKHTDADEKERLDEQEKLYNQMLTEAATGIYRVSVALELHDPTGDIESLKRYGKKLERDLLLATDAQLHCPWGAQIKCWQNTHPFGKDRLRVRRRYVSRNVADTTPLVAARSGSPTGPVLGWADPLQTLERLNLFDKAHKNHLGLVVGDTGSGKTQVVIEHVKDAISLGAQVTIIDRAGHYEFLCALIPGAASLKLGAGLGYNLDGTRSDPWALPPAQRPAAVNPWDVPDLRKIPDDKRDFLLDLHAVLVGDRQSDGTYALSALNRSLLSTATSAVYDHCRQTGDIPRELLLEEKLRQHAAEHRSRNAQSLADACLHLASALTDYVGDGPAAYVADWPTTVPDDSPLVVFDTEAVSDIRLAAAMVTVIEAVKDRGERNYALRENAPEGTWIGRNLLVVDEGWKVLMSAATAAWIMEIARRSRHYGLAILFLTQELADFLRKPEGRSLIKQSSVQLLLRQPAKESIEDCVTHLTLTKPEGQMLKTLKQERGHSNQLLFCNGTRGRGLITLRHGKAEQWLATSEKQHDQPTRLRVLAQHGGDAWAALVDLAENHELATAA